MKFTPLLAVVLLLVVLVVVAFSSTSSDAARSIISVQFLHRHGARTPILSGAAATAVCGSEEKCGQLTPQGALMLEQLGLYLRQRYVDKTQPGPDPPSAAFQTAFSDGKYNHFADHVRSTDVDRTLQSAGARLRGFVKNTTTLLPIIHTVSDPSKDQMMIPESNAALAFPSALKMLQCLEEFKDTYPRFASLEEMKAAAKEVSLGSLCDPLTNTSTVGEYIDCGDKLSDTGRSFLSMGILSLYPTLEKYLPKFKMITTWLFETIYRFDPSRYSDQKNHGSYSFPLYTQMFSNFDAAVAKEEKLPGSPTNLPILYEFSAHDTTISPFMQTQISNIDLVRPHFAQAVVLELVYDDVKKKFYVQQSYGAPKTMESKLNPSEYAYNFSYIPVPCKDKQSGLVANVTDGTCEYADFKAYINDWAAPKDPAGLCYLNDKIKKLIQLDTYLGVPTSSYPLGLQTYRTMCADFGCPSGYSVNPADKSCSKVYSPPSSSTTTSATSPPATSSPQTQTTTTTLTNAPQTPSPNNNNKNNNSTADYEYTKGQFVEGIVGAAVSTLVLGIAIGILVAHMIHKRRAQGEGMNVNLVEAD